MTCAIHCKARLGVTALVIALLGCGGSDPRGTRTATGPAPGEMCAAGSVPVAAAYDRATGRHRWSTCSEEHTYRTIIAANEVGVYVGDAGPSGWTALDPADGTPLASTGPPQDDRPVVSERCRASAPYLMAPILVDDVCLAGGQDDRLRAADPTTGKVLWEDATARLPYDDIWAVGDGAIYVVTGENDSPWSGPLAAYDLASGNVRWKADITDPHQSGFPWYVDDGQLFTIWTNLTVRSTHDGSMIWSTDFPPTDYPRITGVRANDDTVFIAFSSVPSGGD